MGVCSGKPITITTQKVNPNNLKFEPINEEFKRSAKSIGLQSRKNVKQKAAVVDSRLRNSDSADAPTAVILNKLKSISDLKLINQSLEKHFIFKDLTTMQRNIIIADMKLLELEPSQLVFQQECKGSAFFIISTGRVEVLVNENRVAVLKAGESFGELALLHDTPRSATIKTLVKTTLWCVDRTAFRKCLEELNAQNFDENRNFIKSIPVFDALSDGQKDDVASSLSVLKFPSGTKIFNEGDRGELLYIVKEGTVVCTQQGKEVRKIGKGDYFGEQALFYGTARTATVITSEDVVCLALGHDDFLNCLGASLPLIIYKNTMRIAFSRNENLNKLSEHQAKLLINDMEIQSFEAGNTVIPVGEQKKAGFYVVVKGELCFRNQAEAIYKVSDVIGEEQVIKESNGVWDRELVALRETDVAHISSSGFFNSIGGDFEKISAINDAMNSLKKVQLFRGLNSTQLMKLVTSLNIQEFSDGDEIVKQDRAGECFYLIKSGTVEIIKDGQVITSITKNDYFGERSLLLDNDHVASVFARQKVVCWVMSRADFIENIDERIKKHLLERIELQDARSTPLSDLVIVKTLGSGMFGNVFLVVSKTTNKLYALKAVSRKKIDAYQIEENILLERKILLQLDHSLIMKLVRTAKDGKRLYFLMEYIRGMDMFDILRKLNLLKECDARFYVGCIINILEHLHEREIIFRDMKPENMVVDSLGYPKLIDFGTAKRIRGRTYTIVGTPHYMAPEVVNGHGYGLSADYWTLGVMLYEFMFGSVPFGEDETDPYGIYEKIQERKLDFPQWVDNKNKVREFISQLLNKIPANRLGGSFEKLRAHPWLMGVNWDKITSKELKAPYVPVLNPLDEEIESALKANKHMDEIISKIENADEVKKHKRTEKAPPRWDEEF